MSVFRASPIVLLVDDHEDSAAMYAIGLLAMGFQPVLSQSADHAFTRACQLQPDVVVAAGTSTDVSGVELTCRLRGDDRTKDAGIIVLMGHALGSARQEAADAGCDRFLVKPCLPDVLALEIRDVLHQRHAATSARTGESQAQA
jgi:two-component system, cell cycle response regulator DivK